MVDGRPLAEPALVGRQPELDLLLHLFSEKRFTR